MNGELVDFVCAEVMGKWNRKILRVVAASVDLDEAAKQTAKKRKLVYSEPEENSSKMLDNSASKRGSSCPPHDSTIEQINPQSLLNSEQQKDSSKMMQESSQKKRAQSGKEEFQIHQNNTLAVLASEMRQQSQPHQLALPLSSSRTQKNSAYMIVAYP